MNELSCFGVWGRSVLNSFIALDYLRLLLLLMVSSIKTETVEVVRSMSRYIVSSCKVVNDETTHHIMLSLLMKRLCVVTGGVVSNHNALMYHGAGGCLISSGVLPCFTAPVAALFLFLLSMYYIMAPVAAFFEK